MPIATPYTTYDQILTALIEAAMTVVRFAAAATKTAPTPGLVSPVRTFVVLSALVRRAIVISRYLETLPPPAEQQNGQLMPTIDWVIGLFAEHKIDAETYHAMIDAEVEGEFDDDAGYVENADVEGRRPMVLVAELCRDFGMATHALPPEWLAPVPSDLRLLCARAAAAAIRPTGKADRIGHLMER